MHAAFALGLSAFAQVGQPQAFVDDLRVDLGLWPKAVPILYVFGLHNGGDAVLHTNVLSRSCSCVATPLDAMSVLPGGTGRLQVGVQAGHAKDHVAVKLGTNDPAKPEIVLELSAKLVDGVEPMPRSINLGAIAADTDIVRNLDLLCVAPYESTQIRDVRSETMPVVLTRTEQVEPGRNRCTLTFRLPPVGPRCAGTIVVHTDSPRYPEIEIPVTAQIKYPLAATPAYVLLDENSSLAPAAVHLNGSGASTPLTATSDDPRVAVSIRRADVLPDGTMAAVLHVDTTRVRDSDDMIRARALVRDATGRVAASVAVLGIAPNTR